MNVSCVELIPSTGISHNTFKIKFARPYVAKSLGSFNYPKKIEFKVSTAMSKKPEIVFGIANLTIWIKTFLVDDGYSNFAETVAVFCESILSEILSDCDFSPKSLELILL